MVSHPSYDPNEYYKSDVKAFKNWSLADLYEPGSTFAFERGDRAGSWSDQSNSMFNDPM